ncbi:MAG: histidine ammonia-lyase [Streptosporangiales bacterium]|nr:histidine ammonia-lyase [Streptosporangiales bacterium]
MESITEPEDLDIPAISRIAAGAGVTLDTGLRDRMRTHRATVLDALTSGDTPVYGVNTGMGRLAQRRLTLEEQAGHQAHLFTARAVGGPPWLPEADARAVLAVKLRTLVTQESGASPELAEYVAARLGDGFTPAIPREGNGSAGEIIPLCHAFQTFLGLGTVLEEGTEVPAAETLARRGVPPVRLGPKEGMTLLQGSPVATAQAIMRGGEAGAALRLQVHAAAGTVAALGAPRGVYDPRLAGPDEVLGAMLAAVRNLGAGGPVREDVVQAPVSVRVAPQALAHAARTVDDLAAAADRTLAAVTDSPAFLDGGFVSTGAFHAVELGLRMDAVSAALIHLAEGSVQRLHRLLDERFTGLPPQLAVDPGPQAGLITTHKRAVGELHALRGLAAPATLGTIDTSGGQEDLQAFAGAAGERLRTVVHRLGTVTACELIAAHQATALREADPPPALRDLYATVAQHVPLVTEDRSLGPEIERLATILRTAPPQIGGKIFRRVGGSA